MSHSDPMLPILAQFRPLFTAPTWKKMMTLLTGTILARGRRTVTAALWQTGHQLDSNFSRFHQVLKRARWSPLELSRQLLLLIRENFIQAGGGIDVVIDETLERRWGAKMSKRGHYRDSALSSRKRSVSSPGLRWIVMAVVVTVDWYGEGKRVVEICTATALWYRYGSDPLPIRWVLTRDPESKRPPKALFSTDQCQAAEEIVLDFMKRWSLETTFEEGHAHLGLETQRQWSDLAIERTTPLLFGLYSLVTLFGHALYPHGQLPLKQAAWYHKQAATFGDVLAVVRRHLWGNFTFPTSPADPDVVLVPRSTLSRLAQAVCY